MDTGTIGTTIRYLATFYDMVNYVLQHNRGVMKVNDWGHFARTGSSFVEIRLLKLLFPCSFLPTLSTLPIDDLFI